MKYGRTKTAPKASKTPNPVNVAKFIEARLVTTLIVIRKKSDYLKSGFFPQDFELVCLAG